MQDWLNTFVTPMGMNLSLIYFLLVIPFISLIGTMSRHWLGFKSMSLGVLLAMSFVFAFIVEMNSLYSFAVAFVLIIFIYYCSYFVKKFTLSMGMHYYARIAFVISTISIIVLLIFLGLYQIEFIRMNYNYLAINSFAVILAVALAEQFASHQTQKGLKTSRGMFFTTLLMAGLIGFLISLEVVKNVIFDYPYLIFLALLINFLMGKYQGMRLNEVVRFQHVANSDSSEEKND